jgi:succinoglycan biosynthesis protein ExoM
MRDEAQHTDAAVIAVLTYRRNDDLLTAIAPLLREAAAMSPPATLLIIDNDPDAGAESVVTALGDQRVRYVHEPQPGIAAARNRALREAGARFLAFIDDDMHPGPGWLSALMHTQQATGAAVVAGPVLAEYETEPDDWIRGGRFFVRRRMPTGVALDVAASGNMLLDLPQIDAIGLHFDERFGLLGGSDHLFSRTLARRGIAMVWCDEAIAFDRVPADRMTPTWVLRRAFRSGNSQILVSLALCENRLDRMTVRARAAVGGTARIGVGTMRYFLGVVSRSVVHRARGQRMQHRGYGMLAGVVGHAYAEYARAQVAAPGVVGAP